MRNSVHLKGSSLLSVILLLSMALFVNSCSKDNKADTPLNQNPGNPNEVIIQGSSFTPASIEVAAGTKVTWRNNDGMAHTVTSDNGLFDSGNIGNSGSYSFTFTAKGTYGYHCTIHSGMTGTVVVN